MATEIVSVNRTISEYFFATPFHTVPALFFQGNATMRIMFSRRGIVSIYVSGIVSLGDLLTE